MKEQDEPKSYLESTYHEAAYTVFSFIDAEWAQREQRALSHEALLQDPPQTEAYHLYVNIYHGLPVWPSQPPSESQTWRNKRTNLARVRHGLSLKSTRETVTVFSEYIDGIIDPIRDTLKQKPPEEQTTYTGFRSLLIDGLLINSVIDLYNRKKAKGINTRIQDLWIWMREQLWEQGQPLPFHEITRVIPDCLSHNALLDLLGKPYSQKAAVIRSVPKIKKS